MSFSVRGQTRELFSYSPSSQAEAATQAVRRDGVVRRRLARVEPSTLAGVRALVLERSLPAALTLNLFDDTVLTGLVERTAPTFSGGYSVSGRLADGTLGSMALVVNGDTVTGAVRTLGGVYEIRSIGGGIHSISKVDESHSPWECGVPDSAPVRSDGDDPVHEHPSLDSPIVAVPSPSSTAPTQFDVLFVYTPAARNYEGGTAEINARMDLMIAETNEAYAASGVNLRVSAAGTLEVDYTSLVYQDLNRLERSADGYLDAVHDVRDDVAADAVVMLVKWSDDTAVNGVAPYVSTPAAAHAFSVVNLGLRSSVVFAHELAHNMAVRHDRYVACGQGCNGGRYVYSYGYVNAKALVKGAPESARWRTIMAYRTRCADKGFECTQLLRFSNPTLSYPEFVDHMGVPGEDVTDRVDGPADAARSMNQTREIVAAFRAFDPGLISFAADAYTATEGGTDAEVTVELEAAFNRRVVVQLEVATVNGARSADYAGVPVALVFAAGDTEQTFTVEAVDDAADDDGEKITITIGGGWQGDPSTTTVTLADNDTVAAAPSVTAVSVVSDAGTDATYGRGETIEVAVALTKSPVVTGTPQLQLTFGSGTEQAQFSGTAGDVMTFEYTVAASDSDTDGISIAADSLTLNGGTVKDGSDQAAVLDHGAVANQGGHQVDGVGPRFGGAAVDGDRMSLVFGESLGATTDLTPARSSFSVRAGGSTLTVTDVQVVGKDVRLKLSPRVLFEQTVTVGYSHGNRRLSDIFGNPAAAFSGQAVSNTTPLIVYDLDFDGLIEVSSLAQFDAVRHDLDGNGEPSASGAVEYLAVFPDEGSTLDCAGGCKGYELEADLDFDTNGNRRIDSGDDYWRSGSGWAPLGSSSTSAFSATFDGNGHTIKNLFIDGTAAYVGLFGFADRSSVIRDVGVLNADVSTSNRSPGAAGILAGRTAGNVVQSYARGSVFGYGYVGGLVGWSGGGGEISSSFALAGVSGSRSVGGLVGYVAGLVDRSYANGSVSGDSSVGGLVGYSVGEVHISYATGIVTGSSSVGGLVGTAGEGRIEHSYAVGPVVSAGSSGGLVGSKVGGSEFVVWRSVWDATTSGLGGGPHGAGLTTEKLQTAPGSWWGFVEWRNRWKLGGRTEYPALDTDLNGDGRSTWQEFGNQLRGGPILTKVVSPAGLELSWTAVDTSYWTQPPSVRYNVYRREGNTVTLMEENLSGRSHFESSSQTASAYRYQVAALVLGQEASWSSIVDANAPATGQPTISGTPLLREMVAASTAGIEDLNGLTGVTFDYQWLVRDGGVDEEIPGATGPTYSIGPDVAGKAVKVRVSFIDDVGSSESVLSPELPTGALRFISDALDVAEGSGTVTLTVLTGGVTLPTHETITIEASTLGTATAGDDYMVGSPSLTLYAGADSASTTLTVVNDRIDEDGETIQLVARLGVSESLPYLLSIVDDDARGVLVSETSLAVEEGSSSSYAVVLTSEPTAEVEVTATLDRVGADVSLDRTTLAFDQVNWEVPQEIRVSAASDSDTEADSLVTVRHRASGGDYAFLAVADLRVMVVETGAPTVWVEDERVAEGAGAVVLHVGLSLATNADVTVDYATSDGSGPDGALAGSDYTASTGTITFVAGTTAEQAIRVPILDDAADEAEAEIFSLTLSNAVGASLAGGGGELEVMGTIVDDDGAQVSVSFDSPSYEATEGMSVEVEVNLDRDPERVVTIPLIKTHHGGATESDYSGVPNNVVFGPGITSRVLEFKAIADSEDDDGEAVVLRFGSLPAGVTGAGETNVAIRDGGGSGGGTGGGTGGGGGSPPPPDPDPPPPPPPPPPTVSLAAAEALESAGAVVFDVRLSASSGAAVTVDYATADGAGASGAEAGSDYTATQATLTFPAGSSTRQIRVLVTDDAADEGDAETFTLTLSNPTNASLAGGGSVLRVTGTIRDDDSGPPMAAFAVTGASCAADLCRTVTGEAVEFVDTSAGTVRSRRWEFGDGKTSRSRRPEYAWSSPGFYEVTLWVSDGVTESVASRRFLVEASDPAGSCVADEETLCLQDSRYAVTVAWWTGAGESGAGSVVHAGTNDSGLFTFFSRENWEVLIKVLDGCALNGRVWVYGASTTDLGYTIRVADTVTGTVKEYRNEPGLPAPAITDATAFDACAR